MALFLVALSSFLVYLLRWMKLVSSWWSCNISLYILTKSVLQCPLITSFLVDQIHSLPIFLVSEKKKLNAYQFLNYLVKSIMANKLYKKTNNISRVMQAVGHLVHLEVWETYSCEQSKSKFSLIICICKDLDTRCTIRSFNPPELTNLKHVGMQTSELFSLHNHSERK